MRGNWLGVVLSVVLISIGYVIHNLIGKKNKFLARKVLHIFVSNWFFIYANFFDSVWYAIFGLLAFAALNLVLELKLFHSRKYGTVYYPLSIIVLICLQQMEGVSNVAVGCGILVMGYGDGLAAIVGHKLDTPYMPLLREKTIGGSLTMFIVSSIVILLVSKCSILYALLIGFVAALSEAYIPFGFDNISVPIFVYFLVRDLCLLG